MFLSVRNQSVLALDPTRAIAAVGDHLVSDGVEKDRFSSNLTHPPEIGVYRDLSESCVEFIRLPVAPDSRLRGIRSRGVDVLNFFFLGATDKATRQDQCSDSDHRPSGVVPKS